MTSPYPRDSQVGKVNQARALIGALEIADSSQVVTFAQRITTSTYWTDHPSLGSVARVRYMGSGGCNARIQVMGGASYVRIPARSWNKTYVGVVHALSHLITPPDEDHPWHSPEWAKTFFEMTARFVGPHVESEVKAAFREVGFKSRVIPEATRRAAAQRKQEREEAKLQGDLEALLSLLSDT